MARSRKANNEEELLIAIEGCHNAISGEDYQNYYHHVINNNLVHLFVLYLILYC